MRRILFATDGSRDALGAAQYVAHLYKAAPEVEVTALNVSPSIPPVYRELSHDPAVQKQFMAWKKNRENEARGYFDAALKVLLDAGIKKSHIKTKYAHQVVGVARDIIREMDAALYDACVVGKKGMGWIDSIFLGSITGKLLELSINHPLWLVDGKGMKSHRVLVALDETDRAIELVRYTGRMLLGLDGVHILLYHHCAPCTEPFSPEERKRMKDAEKHVVESERSRMQRIFEKAGDALAEVGIKPKSVKYEFDYTPSAHPKKVSRAILSKLKEGDFGSLVLGRKGKTGAREFNLGSATLRTISEAQHCAVWVI